MNPNNANLTGAWSKNVLDGIRDLDENPSIKQELIDAEKTDKMPSRAAGLDTGPVRDMANLLADIDSDEFEPQSEEEGTNNADTDDSECELNTMRPSSPSCDLSSYPTGNKGLRHMAKKTMPPTAVSDVEDQGSSYESATSFGKMSESSKTSLILPPTIELFLTNVDLNSQIKVLQGQWDENVRMNMPSSSYWPKIVFGLFPLPPPSAQEADSAAGRSTSTSGLIKTCDRITQVAPKREGRKEDELIKKFIEKIRIGYIVNAWKGSSQLIIDSTLEGFSKSTIEKSLEGYDLIGKQDLDVIILLLKASGMYSVVNGRYDLRTLSPKNN